MILGRGRPLTKRALAALRLRTESSLGENRSSRRWSVRRWVIGRVAAGVRLLGHASTQTTGDTYADWDIDQLANTLRAVLEGASESLPRPKRKLLHMGIHGGGGNRTRVLLTPRPVHRGSQILPSRTSPITRGTTVTNDPD